MSADVLAEPPQAAISARDGGVTAESDGELFQTYSEDGTPLGLQLRAVCHREGIWHRAVYAYLFNSSGELLIQRRALGKKVAPGQWDLSVAEHLTPGEAFRDGVVRGLAEELGVQLSEQQQAALRGPLAPVHQRRLLLPEIGIKDFEFIEAYRLDGWDGPITFNDQEVAEVKWVRLEQVRADMAARPHEYTAWFREELAATAFE